MSNCYCHTCDRTIGHRGIASHRAAHRRRKENCKITYSHGDTWNHRFAEKPKEDAASKEKPKAKPAAETPEKPKKAPTKKAE